MERLIRWTFEVSGRDEYQKAELNKILSGSAVLVYWLLYLGMFASLIIDGFWTHYVTAGSMILVIIALVWGIIINVQIRKHGLYQIEAANEEDLQKIYRRINFQAVQDTIIAGISGYAGWSLVSFAMSAQYRPTIRETVVFMVVFVGVYAVTTWRYRRRQVIKAWEDN